MEHRRRRRCSISLVSARNLLKKHGFLILVHQNNRENPCLAGRQELNQRSKSPLLNYPLNNILPIHAPNDQLICSRKQK